MTIIQTTTIRCRLKAELPPHGKCSYSVKGNIVTIHATGPWNLEFFKKMHYELGQILLHEVDFHNFAILLILKGDSLAAKDGLDYHLNLVRSGPTKALAIHSTLSDAPQITQSIFQNVYNQAGLKNRTFNSTEEAKIWLKAQLK